MKVALYLRVSTARQAEKDLSIPDQRNQLERWSKDRGWNVVAEYVEAFRRRGLLPGLYYSIWDITEGVAAGQLTGDKLDYIKTQITELLTHYGPIPILVMDGWSWQMGHNAVAYQEIR